MSEIAKRLRDRRANVWEQAKTLTDKAVEENRAFSAQEQGTFDGLNTELDTLDTRIKAVLDQEKRAKESDEAFAVLEGKPKAAGAPAGSSGDQDLAAQFRQLAAGERRNVEVGLPTAFERRKASGVEQRAAMKSSDAPMPTTFIGQLYQYLIDTSSIHQANPTIYTTQSGENLTIPRSTAEGAASWTAEAVQLSESNPTLSSVTLGAYKVGKVLYVGSELVQDTGFDLLGFIAEHAGRNIGVATDTAYVGGAGSTQPTGFLTSATVGLQLAGTGTDTGLPASPGAGDPFIDLFHSVIPQYRARASWLMNDQTIKQVRKIKDSTGQYLWQPSLQLGQPDTLLGKPVYADPNMPVMASNAKFCAFGDFAGYWIRDVTPLRFERSDDFKFDTDVVSFRVLYRTDGKLGDTNAIKVLQNSETA